MTLPDLINGSFESLGGVFLALNCWRLYRDKKIAGISILPTIFYFGWGLWNLVYYPSLSQWFSTLGGIGVVVANGAWVSMAVYYQRKARRS